MREIAIFSITIPMTIIEILNNKDIHQNHVRTQIENFSVKYLQEHYQL